MDRTKALNIFRSFCMMVAIMAGVTLIALAIANFGRLHQDIQIGIGLAIIIAIGTSMIYSTIYGGLSYGDENEEDDFEDDGSYC